MLIESSGENYRTYSCETLGWWRKYDSWQINIDYTDARSFYRSNGEDGRRRPAAKIKDSTVTNLPFPHWSLCKNLYGANMATVRVQVGSSWLLCSASIVSLDYWPCVFHTGGTVAGDDITQVFLVSRNVEAKSQKGPSNHFGVWEGTVAIKDVKEKAWVVVKNEETWRIKDLFDSLGSRIR